MHATLHARPMTAYISEDDITLCEVGILVQFSPTEAKYLEQKMVGRLATASKKGTPHLAPICYASNSEKIFIHTGRNSKKMRNIMGNRRVAFATDEYLSWEKNRGIIVQGVAEILEDGKTYELGRKLIYAKYPKWEQEYPIIEGEEVLLAITPKKVLSWGLE